MSLFEGNTKERLWTGKSWQPGLLSIERRTCGGAAHAGSVRRLWRVLGGTGTRLPCAATRLGMPSVVDGWALGCHPPPLQTARDH